MSRKKSKLEKLLERMAFLSEEEMLNEINKLTEDDLKELEMELSEMPNDFEAVLALDVDEFQVHRSNPLHWFAKKYNFPVLMITIN